MPQSFTVLKSAALICTLALAGCGNEKAGESVPGCTLESGNLLLDTSFTTLFSPASERRWRMSEHAAGGDFETRAADGVLTIRKIGKEPWFIVTQSPDARALAGSNLAFSAEIKLDLREPEHPHSFGYGGGLSVLARRGNKIVVRSNLEHEPHFGTSDWQAVKVVFQLPQPSTYLRVGFLHQAGGTLQVRNPALHRVDPGCQ